MKFPRLRRPRFSLLLVALCAVTACVDETVPTTTNAADTQSAAPVITEIVVTDRGNSLVELRANASDPGGGPLSFSWKVDSGALTANSGTTVFWRVPQAAGNYVATLEAVNNKNVRTTATRLVTVAGDGTAAATGNTQPTGTSSGGNSATGTGQFQIATPVPGGPASAIIVGGNPSAAPTVLATPSPPFTQPIATPAPGVTTSPVTPPGQPIATPTPTTPPVVLPPSPTPTPKPATPEPGVPVPPDSLWVQVNPANVPTTARLNDVHFYTQTKGWAVGSPAAAIFSEDGGKNWQLRQNGIDGAFILNKVFFTDDNNGFITGHDGLVMRTRDGGLTWQNISPQLNTAFADFKDNVTSLAVYNSQIVVIAGRGGRVFRSENANAATAGGVSWRQIITTPADRPQDHPTYLANAVVFPNQTDTTVAFFIGDGIFRLDSDAAEPWKKIVQLGANEGQGLAIAMSDPADVWAGTSGRTLIHVRNAVGGPAASSITTFFNREHNGNNTKLSVTSPSAISFVDANTMWFVDQTAVLETDNAQSANPTWRRTPTDLGFVDLQIEARTSAATGGREFIGWGVGNSGGIFRYLPGGED